MKKSILLLSLIGIVCAGMWGCSKSVLGQMTKMENGVYIDSGEMTIGDWIEYDWDLKRDKALTAGDARQRHISQGTQRGLFCDTPSLSLLPPIREADDGRPEPRAMPCLLPVEDKETQHDTSEAGDVLSAHDSHANAPC